MFRSSHSFAQINGAIYFPLLVINFLNSAFWWKKSKYLNCFISHSFSLHASFWLVFKNRFQITAYADMKSRRESNGNTNVKWSQARVSVSVLILNETESSRIYETVTPVCLGLKKIKNSTLGLRTWVLSHFPTLAVLDRSVDSVSSLFKMSWSLKFLKENYS